jgi:hypothetical protein
MTDFAFHAKNMRPTESIGKKFKSYIDSQEPYRIYSAPPALDGLDPKLFTLEILKNDPDFIQLVQEEEKKGFKILLSLPKEGVPVVLGKDTIEFLKSKNGKRVLRKLAKNKPEE